MSSHWNFTRGIALGGACESPCRIDAIMAHDPLEPDQPFSRCLTSERVESAMRLEERLLNNIRGIDFRLESSVEVASCDRGDKTPAGSEQPVPSCRVTSPRRGEPVSQAIGVAHAAV